ncbi:MAG: hypothetical protein KDN19_05345 [Verrucomicrobiae bacterium]|nr:hypothetical protein [Verrucomicrobiae bacterium]
MFLCLRALVLLVPVAIVAGIVWLAGQARQLSYRNDDDLVVAVREVPTRFDPLMPGSGFEREVTELIFDRLLRLDDDLRQRPHLLDSWEYRHRATCYFTGEKTASEAAGILATQRDLWPEWHLVDAVLDGDQMHLMSSDPERRWLDEIVNRFDPKSLVSLLHVRLRLREAVDRSLSDFLAGSVEKNQLKHLDYDGDKIANLYLLGDTDLFLKELRLYYESNRNLEPSIEIIGPVNRLAELDFDLVLREDLRWHDGQPVTADDLLFTFEEVTRAGSESPLRDAFSFVESAEVIDDHRLRTHLQEFYAPALERWGKLTLLPAHLLRQAVGPETWRDFFARPVGTGPYRIESVTPGRSLELVANTDYFRGCPRQTHLRYRRLADPAQRKIEWRLGRVDAMAPAPDEERWLREESGQAKAAMVRDVGRYQSFVTWNLDRPIFADPRVRRGLAHLIDVEGLLKSVPGTEATPWKGLFFPGSWFCEDSPGPLSPDEKLAVESFEAAGWERGEEGSWRTKEGQVVELTLSYDEADPLHSRLAKLLEAQWKSGGVNIRLEPMEWRSLIEDRLAPREFDALLLSWELDFSRDHYAVWHSSEAGPGGTNFSGLRNQEVDALLERLRREREDAAVIATATELQEEIRELQPCLFVCNVGRELAYRTEAVEQARPGAEGEWTTGPVTVGRAGLFASRPWWVRNSKPREKSGDPGASETPEP